MSSSTDEELVEIDAVLDIETVAAIWHAGADVVGDREALQTALDFQLDWTDEERDQQLRLTFEQLEDVA